MRRAGDGEYESVWGRLGDASFECSRSDVSSVLKIGRRQ